MDERDRRAPAARAGYSIDGRRAGRLHRLQRLGAVVDPVADVMESLSTLLDRLGDRRVLTGGSEQWHVAVGDLEQCFLDSVGLDGLPMVDGGAERPRVIVDGRLEVAHGN